LKRAATDLDDVFTGPAKVKTESGYTIAPPPPASIPSTRLSNAILNDDSTLTVSVIIPAANSPSQLVNPSMGPASPTISPAAVVSPTHTNSLSPASIALSSTVSPPAVAPAPTNLPTTVVSPAIAAAQALNNLNMSLMPALHDMMEALRWTCPNHYILGIEDPVEHKATTCTLGKCNNSDDGWKTWRKGLHFIDGCCYGCGVEKDVSFFFDRVESRSFCPSAYFYRRIGGNSQPDSRRADGSTMSILGDVAHHGMGDILDSDPSCRLRTIHLEG
jgi:hypothetical protein